MKQVSVVIPIYKIDLNKFEQISFDSIYNAYAGKYPITIVKPSSLDISSFTNKYKHLLIESFKDDYFKSIAGYNRLMLSEEFYARFSDYEYILIAQTDCYIFKDNLSSWCEKGYDYIGAPWLVRPIYKFPLLRLTSYLKKKYCDFTNTPNSQLSNNKIGNGGLSLRKIKSHIEATVKLKSIADQYLNYPKRTAIFNEDVFFALEPNKNGLSFKYPEIQEALRFSYDKYPKFCNQLMSGETPMGCHGWYKRKMIKYWKPIILK
ncbi:MAG: DUF5672 family protein [Rikenellaceae bacterium]